MHLERRFLESVENHGFLKRGDSVLVALSGGPDSTALLYLLNGIRDVFELKLAAAHLDHSIRAESSRDREFCRDLCRGLKIRFYSRRIDIAKIAKRDGSNIEETGRKARYDYLNSLSANYGYKKIATGHTMDDNAETVLFNLIRGAGLTGLRGIPAKRGNIIRPLIGFKKHELVNWLQYNKIKYMTDRTNRSVKYSRNRIRLRILPEMGKINPGIVESFSRFSRIISEDIELIESAGVLVYEKALLSEDNSKIVLDLRELLGYDKNLEKAAIREAFRRLTGDRRTPSFDSFARIITTISGKSGGKSPLGSGIWIQKSQNRVSLFKEKAVRSSGEAISLVIPGITSIEGCDLKLVTSLKKRGEVESLKTSPTVALLDYGRIQNPKVRFRKDGDRIRPFGMKGTRLLSDLFIDRKIPVFERGRIPLVVSGRKIAWVAGLAASDDFKVGPSTEMILRIELCGH